MKFNIGDKIFNPSCIQFFCNPYWYDDKMRLAFSSVKKTTEKWFATDEDCDLTGWGGGSGYHRFSQDGVQMTSPGVQWFHVEKDRDIINKILFAYFENEKRCVLTEKENEIQELKDKMDRIKDKISLLESNVVRTVMGEDSLKFIDDRENEIKNLLD